MLLSAFAGAALGGTVGRGVVKAGADATGDSRPPTVSPVDAQAMNGPTARNRRISLADAWIPGLAARAGWMALN